MIGANPAQASPPCILHAMVTRAAPSPLVVFAAAAVGSAVEFYDFFAYGTAAALVFPTVFFPSLGAEAARLASFATLGAAFVARPAGAMVFGHFGDRIGRKRTLVVTLLLMGASTVCVGLVPGADRIGFAAPALVLGLRLAQGFAVGGEMGGAVVLSAESAPPGRSGLMGSAGAVGAALGYLLSSLSFLAVSLFSAARSSAFLAWGWRVPFLLSGLLILIGVYVRRHVPESPAFVAARESGELIRAPLRELARRRPAQLALVTGSVCAPYVVSFFRDSFVVSVARSELGLPFPEILQVNVVGGVVWLLVVVAAGACVDKLPRKTLYIAGLALISVWSVVVMPVLTSGAPGAFALATLLSILVLGVANGAVAAFLVEDFPVHLRYSGFAVAFNVAGVLGGALPPVLAAGLYGSRGPGAVGLMLLAFSLASLACAVATTRFAPGSPSASAAPERDGRSCDLVELGPSVAGDLRGAVVLVDDDDRRGGDGGRLP